MDLKEKKPHILDRKAEGGRIGFADGPPGKIKVAEPIFTKSNIKPIMVEESKVLEILGIEPGSKEKKTFYTQKGKNKGKFNKLTQITGEPVKSVENVPGTQHKKTLYNIADLNEETIKWVNDPKSRRIYSDEGRGKLVTKDKNLRKLFIEKYNLGHGPKNIMVLIDPENKLGVNQERYGGGVAEELIKEGALTKRTTQSLEHKAYTDKKTKTTDLAIEKIAKIYDKSPSGSLERIAHALAGGKANFDKLSPRLQTEFMTKAGRRSFDLLQYLEGNRPSVDKNTNINLKNKDAIFQVLNSSKHPMWPMVKEGDVRNYKFAELDYFFGDPTGTHARTRNDIHKFLQLNNAPKGLFVIDEGPGLTTALKNGLPILARFSNLFNKKTNQAKIELDLKLRTVYPILTNLDNGKDKYKITKSDLKKSEIYGWGLKEKDIGKIINKKDHPAIKEYNKFSKSFSKANKVKTPIFKFGNISENLDLDDRRWVTEESAKELKNMNKKYGFYAANMGTDVKLIKTRLQERPLKKVDFTKPQIVLMKMRDGLQDVYNKIPLKGLRVAPSAAAAVLDYNFFHNVMGIPSQEAAIGAATWLVKNKEAAQRIGYALMAVSSGNMEIEEFIKKHGKELVGISQEAVLSVPEDDTVFTERMTQMDEMMKVPVWSKIKKDKESGKTYEEGSEIDKSIELEKKGKELAETMSDTEIELRGQYPTASDEEIKDMLRKLHAKGGSVSSLSGVDQYILNRYK
tara:strand:+ start:1 stop:2220 length:2220 start_codon:yes stop_codon:yes gene_type:complete